mmetsp:Transcript_30019/g.95928  ORF Transcript_30019/g.95928 Transcript_30019/m.95928 type:complete len:296 (+) Transcript_30019:980-1867(+)
MRLMGSLLSSTVYSRSFSMAVRRLRTSSPIVASPLVNSKVSMQMSSVRPSASVFLTMTLTLSMPSGWSLFWSFTSKSRLLRLMRLTRSLASFVRTMRSMISLSSAAIIFAFCSSRLISSDDAPCASISCFWRSNSAFCASKALRASSSLARSSSSTPPPPLSRSCRRPSWYSSMASSAVGLSVTSSPSMPGAWNSSSSPPMTTRSQGLSSWRTPSAMALPLWKVSPRPPTSVNVGCGSMLASGGSSAPSKAAKSMPSASTTQWPRTTLSDSGEMSPLAPKVVLACLRMYMMRPSR